MNQSWWDKNKVLLLGLLSAIATAITPFVQNGEVGETVKWATIGWAALIGILAYLANKWRGQGLTVFGLIGNAAGVVVSLLEQGTAINTSAFVTQLVLQFILAVAMAAGADPKSRGYENTETIKQAKREGEEIVNAPLTNKAQQ